VKDLVRPALFVPDTQRPAETLALLRERGAGPAIVVDENGRTAGLVCCGDIAFATLGETRHVDTAPVALPAEPGVWIVSAAMRRAEFERVFETRLPAGSYETLAGLVLWRLGRMPRVGEQVTAGRVLITVQGATRQAVLALKISLPR
jgi:CBS domain containing-hemolysin-like protein